MDEEEPSTYERILFLFQATRGAIVVLMIGLAVLAVTPGRIVLTPEEKKREKLLRNTRLLVMSPNWRESSDGRWTAQYEAPDGTLTTCPYWPPHKLLCEGK